MRDIFFQSCRPNHCGANRFDLRHLGCQGATIQHRGGRALHEGERYIKESESQWADSVANGDASVVERILARLLRSRPDSTLGLWNMVRGRSAITSQALMRGRVPRNSSRSAW